ncbi:outer membrane beta-barrel protein [Arcticibacter sp. MXS-1]|uniref:outer membrane beta-barrel protein n=1 Tax=Arcticibacter sp. MXS-1 TaxID=3341726 RepID=UPI0035A8EACA
MKRIILLAAGFLVGGTAFAQIGTPSAAPGKTRWGLKVGVNLPKYHVTNTEGEDSESKSTTNFHVTGYADVPVSNYFYVQPGISLQGKGGKLAENKQLNTKWEYNTMEIGVPINFVGKLPVGPMSNLYLGAGPYVSFAVGGESKVTAGGTTTKEDLKFGSDRGNNLKRTDAGLNFLGGVEINSFNIGAGYGLGLVDLRPEGEGGNGKLSNRVWSFSVGYSF